MANSMTYRLIQIEEYGYVMKYAELNGRNLEPWSLRQLAFYHQVDTQTNNSVLVLLLPGPPSKSIVFERIRDALKGTVSLTNFPEIYLRLNGAILNSYLYNWGDYMCYYESQLQYSVRPPPAHRTERLRLTCTSQADRTMEPGGVENESVTPQHLETLHFLHGPYLAIGVCILKSRSDDLSAPQDQGRFRPCPIARGCDSGVDRAIRGHRYHDPQLHSELIRLVEAMGSHSRHGQHYTESYRSTAFAGAE